MGLPIIGDLRKLFFQTTGLTISFHNPSTDRKDFFPLVERARFCEIIHSSHQGRQRCDSSDEKATRKAIKKGSPYVFTCHAGLTDVVVPIIVGGRHIGTILSGQLLTQVPTHETFRNIKRMVKGLDVDPDALEESLNEVTVIPRRKVEVAVQMLSLISRYIAETEMRIQLQRKAFEQERKLAEESRARLELENTLKNLRIRALESSGVKLSEGMDRTKEERLMREAIDFIRQNFYHKLTLENVSRAISLSPNYFSALFHKNCGKPFIQHLNELRIEKAKELLADHKLTIAQVAYQSGFEDPNYFCLAFKKATGSKPTAFRNKILS
jgi:AraC-like DNA-binding protein/ligand-binding sensor protein